jgi:RNA polymerase sigma-70 factor (ECF subfamily)
MKLEKTDGDLIAAFKNGTASTREQAFAELLKRHREKVYWACRRMLKSHEDADDVAQNVFIKVYRSLNQFQEEAQFSTWIYKIATNESINFLRAQKVRETDSIDNLVAEPTESSARPDEALHQSEQRAVIEAAIAALPEKQRAVFVMRYYDELSYEEIAEIVGTSVGGLKANYFHAFKKVEEYIKSNWKNG